MQTALVFNVQKYSIHDGPGIRTTVFLKGCPLSCVWCHNPESMLPRREVLILERRCMACAECRIACPQVQPGGSGPLPRNVEKCDLCGTCVEACPTGAREIVGREMTVDEVLAEIRQDEAFYRQSGGGGTFSGGEPLVQKDFLREALLACKAHDIHTAVDTCGMARVEDLMEIAPLTDVFLYDLKLMDDSLHRQHTGVSNSVILENLLALGKVHNRIWIRVPVIPGINDSPENFEATARFVSRIGSVRQVNLLPFHCAAIAKQERLGQVSQVAQVRPPGTEAIDAAVKIFNRAGLRAVPGG